MNEQEALALRKENADLKAQVHNLEVICRRLESQLPQGSAVPAAPSRSSAPIEQLGDVDTLYDFIKSRLLEEAPGLLKVITVRPELEVQVKRRTIEADGDSVKGRVAKLLANNWFAETKTFSATRAELKRTGPDVNNKSLANIFKELVAYGFLTKEGTEGYRAVPGMKARVVEVK